MLATAQSSGGSALAPPEEARAPLVPSAMIGLALFVATEAMFFGGLISAFIVLRAGEAAGWPPPGQPRLPVLVTAASTAVLLLSAVTMQLAVSRLRLGGRRHLRWLAATAALGTVFLAVQGFEWVRLVGFGLTMRSSVFGGAFYTLIGSHGAHVLGALCALLWVWRRAVQGHYTQERTLGLRLCRLYWFFVVGVWPVLYGLVYLS